MPGNDPGNAAAKSRREQQLERRLKAALRQLKAHREAKADRPLVSKDALALLNHQFRSPLSTLTNALGLLRDSMLSAEQMEWVLAAISAVGSITYHVNQVGELGELTSGKIELELGEISLTDLLEDVVDLYETQAKSDRTRLFAGVTSRGSVRLTVDTGRVREILINMLSQAMVHGRGGLVDITCDFADNELRIHTRTRVASELEGLPEGDPLETLTHVLLTRLTQLLGGRCEAHAGQQEMEVTVGVPARLARNPTDRYVASLRQALEEKRVVVFQRGEVSQRVSRIFTEWGVNWRKIAPGRGAPKITPGETVLAGLADLPVLRTVAKSGIPVLVLAAPGATLIPNSDIPALRIQRFPLSVREILESVAEPKLRRFDHRNLHRSLLATQNPSHILIAEDNIANRMVTVRMLERMGHRVHAVADGREAVSSALQFEFDLILMDIGMPIMDGVEATQRILADTKSSEAPPIIAITARPSDKVRKACLSAGMSDFFMKPIAADELAELVERFGAEGKLRRVRRASGKHREKPILDRGAIIRMRKEVDASLIPEMGALFLLEVDAKVADAQIKQEANQMALVSQILEPLKSSGSSFGARQLHALIEQIQSAIQTGQMDLADYYLKELPQVAARTSELLRSQFKPDK